MWDATLGLRDFKSRITDTENGRESQRTSADRIGSTSGYSERHSLVLRNDFDVRFGTTVTVDGRPEHGFLAGAPEHYQTGVAVKLLVLARIMKCDFEHAGCQLMVIRDRYLYSRKYVTHNEPPCSHGLQAWPITRK
jgi:hypothetical protein